VIRDHEDVMNNNTTGRRKVPRYSEEVFRAFTQLRCASVSMPRNLYASEVDISTVNEKAVNHEHEDVMNNNTTEQREVLCSNEEGEDEDEVIITRVEGSSVVNEASSNDKRAAETPKKVSKPHSAAKKFAMSRVKRVSNLLVKETNDHTNVVIQENNSEASASLSSELSRNSQSRKRKLDESVIDCGILCTISNKEKNMMDVKKLIKEENPCSDMFECSFCSKAFASAGPLTAHLQKHYKKISKKPTRLDCPWPECNFVNTQENLTKHIRSKHTKEELFSCSFCVKRFCTVDAKMAHERKHTRRDLWEQCEDCLRFFSVAKAACSFCQRSNSLIVN